ncbi:MAG TPA: hypothetical protein GXX39_01995 [Syntrophothermus lipocalidus]|nr:hypothetical protein [Syntrophothermus lipocalidus]
MGSFIFVYRLYDVAAEFNLEEIEEVLGGEKRTGRYRLRRARPRSIVVERPPVAVELGTQELEIPAGTMQGRMTARLYDLGVVCLVLALELPEKLGYDKLAATAAYLTETEELEAVFHNALDQVAGMLKPFVKAEPVYDFYEDYLVYFFSELMESWDLVPVLLGETEPLSEATRQETLRHTFSYGERDMAVITWNAAFVYDADGSRDVLDILEFALVQLLELRYYDQLLSEQLQAMYGAVEEAGRGHWFVRLRRYRRIMRQLMAVVLEVTEITDRIQNLLKVTEDVFYARVYGAALGVFRTGMWMNSIRQKIEVIERNYSMMSDEIVSYQSTLLELAIVLLILFEVIMGFIR